MNLINELIESGYLKTPEIIEAFKKIKREDFVLAEDIMSAEVNSPLPIGYGQTISQPLTAAFMIELLKPKKGEKILDVGSGSGWTCALLAQIVGPKGRVYGLEIIPELKEFAEKNLAKYGMIKKDLSATSPSASSPSASSPSASSPSASSGYCVQLFCTDGYNGLRNEAPFDKIIAAAAPKEIPEELLKQLKVGGRLVIPVGEQYNSQDMVVIDKISENKYKEKRYPGFVFVPLVKG